MSLYVFKVELSNGAFILAFLSPLKVFVKSLILSRTWSFSRTLWGQEIKCNKSASEINLWKFVDEAVFVIILLLITELCFTVIRKRFYRLIRPLPKQNECLGEFLTQFYFSALVLPFTLYDPFFAILAMVLRLFFMPVTKQFPKYWNRTYLILIAGLTAYILSTVDWNSAAKYILRESYCNPDSKMTYFATWLVGGTILYQIDNFIGN